MNKSLLSKILKQQKKPDENPLNKLIVFLKSLKETDDIKSKLEYFRKSTKHPLSLSVINFMLSQDSSKTIIILQAKEFVSRIEKNNEITTKELFDNISSCGKNLILEFFNKISKDNIENIRGEIDNFIGITDCKFDEDIINIFNYISEQNDEDLNIIIHSFIRRNKVLAKKRPSLKQYYNEYVLLH
jgi:hypothetical protein